MIRVELEDNEREFIVHCITIQSLSGILGKLPPGKLFNDTENTIDRLGKRIDELFCVLDMTYLGEKLNTAEFGSILNS